MTVAARAPLTRANALPAFLPEQRMAIYGVSWKDYVILREALDTPGLRMTYCQGVLELMSPSRDHELWKKTTARLLETYAFLTRLPTTLPFTAFFCRAPM